MANATPLANLISESQHLHDMLVHNEINFEAEPGIIGKLFPTIVAGKFTASKIKGGVSRVKKEASSTLETMNRMSVNVSINKEEVKSLVDCFLFYFILFYFISLLMPLHCCCCYY